MKLRTYGSLSDPGVGVTEIELQKPESVAVVMGRLGLDKASVKMAMINHRAVRPDALVQPADSLALFPREYPFFADWKDYWSDAED